MSGRDDFYREVGQLLWVGFEGTSLPAFLAKDLAAGRFGGVTLFYRNLAYSTASDKGEKLLAIDQLLDLNASLRAAISSGQAPLFISVDQEGGRVQRVRDPATRWPPMLGIGSLGDDATQVAEQVGAALGAELAVTDFDINFAPVLDINTNPDNPIIGDRAFSTEPKRAAELALAFARGMSSADILPCGKHFPGHGDTSEDSHLQLPRIDRDRQGLEAIELLPFRRAAEVRLPILMTAHVIFSAIDDKLPATLSPSVVGSLLRDEIGYQGLVVSDDLDMKAIAEHYGIAEAAERAILAGCDVLLLCRNRDHQLAAYEGLIHAAEKRSELRMRIGAAAKRVHHLKRDHFRSRSSTLGQPQSILGTSAHRLLARRIKEGLAQMNAKA